MPNALVALSRIGEGRRQQREGSGGEHGAEGALQRARRDEHPEALRRAAEGGRTGEPEQAGDERPFAPEEVGDAPADQQQAAECQRVGRDHPLSVVVGEAQLALGGGKRDVHDRHVEDDHQLGYPDHGKDQPAAVSAGFGLRGHGGISCGHIGGFRFVTALTATDPGM
jgi:hypothetical protein